MRTQTRQINELIIRPILSSDRITILNATYVQQSLRLVNSNHVLLPMRPTIYPIFRQSGPKYTE